MGQGLKEQSTDDHCEGITPIPSTNFATILSMARWGASIEFFDGWKWAPPTFEWLHPLGKGNQLDNQDKEVTMMLELLKVVFFHSSEILLTSGLVWDRPRIPALCAIQHETITRTYKHERQKALVISIHFTATIHCHAYFDKPKLWWYDCHGEFLPASRPSLWSISARISSHN